MTQEEKWQVEAKDARWERTVKRVICALIIVVLAFTASQIIWIYAWMQYDYTSILKADGDSNANYIGNNGDITNVSDNNCK